MSSEGPVLSEELSKIDFNKRDGLELGEIDAFLSNEEKVQKLGDIMQEDFGNESDNLREYKENVGKICERILENDNISLNQGKILFFYLKHFHNENTGVGIDIIKTAVDGSKGNRYKEVVSDMTNASNPESGEFITDERFNNLAGVKEIKEEWENSEKCRHLLESRNLSIEDIGRLNQYKHNGNLDSELAREIEHVTVSGSREICDKLLNSDNALSEEEVQRLEEYKKNISALGMSTSRGRRVNLQGRRRDILSQEKLDKIEERLELEKRDLDILGEVYSDVYNNPLGNIEAIRPEFGKLMPNWKAIIQNIKPKDVEELEKGDDLVEKVNSLITQENISQYLPVPEGISKRDKFYLTNNFKDILVRHLLLHPGYKMCWGLDPNAYAKGMNLEDMVKENNLLESAFRMLGRLRENETGTFDQLKDSEKNQKLKEVFDENNHILFNLRLGELLCSCNKDQKKIGKIVEYIIKYGKKRYASRLDDFAKKNGFINSLCQEYNKAQKEAEEKKKLIEEYKEVEEIMSQADTVRVPENIKEIFSEQEFQIFSPLQIKYFKKYYDKFNKERGDNEAYECFCKFYESSKEFYELKWYEELGLPELPDGLTARGLTARDYLSFIASYANMSKDIQTIEEERDKSCNKYSKFGTAGSAMHAENYFAKEKAKAREIPVIRKYVALWKKSRKPKSDRPDNFMGIPLNWKYSSTDDIIMDSTLDGLKNSAKDFWENATGGCYQQACGDFLGIVTGLTVSTLIARTGSQDAAGAAYYLGGKLGNGIGQVAWDFFVDGFRECVLGRQAKHLVNKYDGAWDSFKLGIGQGKRDKDGNIVDKKSWGEWFIDAGWGMTGAAVSFGITHQCGITIKDNPLLFASIQELAGGTSNALSAGTKARLCTENYGDGYDVGNLVAVGDAIEKQFEKEFTGELLAKKIMNIALVFGMVKLANHRSNSDSSVISKIDSKFKELDSYLKGSGIEYKDLKKLTNKEMKSLMKKGLSGLMSDLTREVQKGWEIALPSLAMSGLLCSTLSPENMLNKRRELVADKMNETDDPYERDIYEKLLKRYDNLKRNIPDMENIDMRLASAEFGGSDNSGESIT